MPCLVCGNHNTVESHVVPRALVRWIAADDQHALVGSADRTGTKFDGKGSFDKNILCQAHENSLGLADDYGVKFLRRFETKGYASPYDDRLWLVSNPKPRLLLKFVAACFWRRAMSPIGVENFDLHLGVRRDRLTNFLFGSTSFEPQLLLSRRVLLSEGKPLQKPVMLEPCRYRNWSVGSWGFTFGTCTMILNLDYTRRREFAEKTQANGANPAIALNLNPAEAVDLPGWAEIIINMAKPRNPTAHVP